VRGKRRRARKHGDALGAPRTRTAGPLRGGYPTANGARVTRLAPRPESERNYLSSARARLALRPLQPDFTRRESTAGQDLARGTARPEASRNSRLPGPVTASLRRRRAQAPRPAGNLRPAAVRRNSTVGVSGGGGRAARRGGRAHLGVRGSRGLREGSHWLGGRGAGPGTTSSRGAGGPTTRPAIESSRSAVTPRAAPPPAPSVGGRRGVGVLATGKTLPARYASAAMKTPFHTGRIRRRKGVAGEELAAQCSSAEHQLARPRLR
jgi:hypothetical protein